MTVVHCNWMHLLAFAYTWLVFGITFGIKAGQSGVKPYYISGLFNSSQDTIPEFFIRWVLWGSIPIVFFRIVQRRFSSRWAWLLLASWMLAIVTGVDPRVFDGSGPPDWLRYSHYVASGLVFLVSSFVLGYVNRYLGWFWVIVTIVYCSTFLASDLSSDLDIPSEIYIATEYALYLTMGVCILLLPPPPPSSPPLEEVRVEVPRVTIPTRERNEERLRR